MTVIRSYSPNGLIRPDPDYDLCCGLFHATTAAKFFAIIFFSICIVVSALNFALFGFEKQWLTLFCVLCTVYCSILVYGVFLEKYSFLIPFLFIHGALTLMLAVFIVVVCIFGSTTDFVKNHHSQNVHLRDLYRMHNVNPDNENTQTLVTSIIMFTTVFSCIVGVYSWYAISQAFKCYKEADRTMLPGYQVGIVASNGRTETEEN